VGSFQFPRWILATGVLIIALMLLLGGLTDAQGNLENLGLGGAAWLAAVACIEGYLVYSARNRKRSGE
jgi:hypothetical protein